MKHSGHWTVTEDVVKKHADIGPHLHAFHPVTHVFTQ